MNEVVILCYFHLNWSSLFSFWRHSGTIRSSNLGIIFWTSSSHATRRVQSCLAAKVSYLSCFAQPRNYGWNNRSRSRKFPRWYAHREAFVTLCCQAALNLQVTCKSARSQKRTDISGPSPSDSHNHKLRTRDVLTWPPDVDNFASTVVQLSALSSYWIHHGLALIHHYIEREKWGFTTELI